MTNEAYTGFPPAVSKLPQTIGRLNHLSVINGQNQTTNQKCNKSGTLGGGFHNVQTTCVSGVKQHMCQNNNELKCKWSMTLEWLGWTGILRVLYDICVREIAEITQELLYNSTMFKQSPHRHHMNYTRPLHKNPFKNSMISDIRMIM